MNSTLQKNNNIGIDHLFILIIFVLVLFEYITNMFSTDKALTSIYLVQMFLCLSVSGFKAFRQLGALHIFSLMHLMLLVFAFGGVIAGIFSPLYDYREMLSPAYLKFPEEIVQKTTLIYTIYICALYVFFWAAYQHFHVRRYKDYVLPTSDRYLETAKKMMYIAFPFEMIYTVKMFIYATSDIGRLLIYQSGAGGLDMPVYLRIANILFNCGFYLLIASSPSKKDFLKFSVIYFITLIPTLLSGERGAVIVPIIFILWFLYRNYGVKFRLKKLVIYASAIIVVSFLLVLKRTGDEMGGLTLSTILFGFLDSSASGYKILCSFIYYGDQIEPHPYPFVIDSFVASLVGVSGQNLESLTHRASIGHHLVYTINPDYYLAGGSLGTSYIAECFEFGIVGVIIGAFVLIMILTFFETRMRKMRFFSIYTLMFFTSFVMSARASLFIGAMSFVRYAIVAYAALSLFDLLNKRKKGNVGAEEYSSKSEIIV